MEKRKNKKLIITFTLIGILLLGVILGGMIYFIKYSKKEEIQDKIKNKDEELRIKERGYNLPIEDEVRRKAEIECKTVMGLVLDTYVNADKGDASNAVISDKTINKMIDKIKSQGYIITSTEPYSNLENYSNMDKFLKECQAGKEKSIVVYKLQSDGGIGREEYSYDGNDMYILNTIASWDENNKPIISYISFDRIKRWKYTEKGWFCYEVCVPEPPEVTEIVDGSCLLRIRPMTKKQQEFSKKCVFLIGYQGNNLLCSNWDVNHMDNIDYNGLYEYLYFMKYNKRFKINNYTNGIPKDEFEKLIMEYLPIKKNQIEEYAVFKKKGQTYAWDRLGCFNYVPHFFGTAIPEVVDIKENKDGTVTLTVDAVCEMMLCNDSVISHELTLRFEKDGSFKYLGNRILNDGLKNIPEYQYRIKK